MLYQAPLFLLLSYLGYVDLKTRRIPNYANIAVFLAALLCQASEQAPATLAITANVVFALVLTLPGYFGGVLGGGDVKLMVALSPAWPPLFLFGSFAIGVLAVGIIMAARSRSGRINNPSLPLATCMALGAMLLMALRLANPSLF